MKEETEEWIGAKEAAKVLGWSVGTLYNRIEEIPHTKLNNRLRFKKSALLQYLNR
ncbi:helix-turn-helix domain-containing protein [Bacteroides sp. CR5/BHMF/2]|nr:helix-turn-helix domain-containing protein [Bacteroides sp. CR5/BHMF/2]